MCSLNTSRIVFLQVWGLNQVRGMCVACCTTSVKRRSHYSAFAPFLPYHLMSSILLLSIKPKSQLYAVKVGFFIRAGSISFPSKARKHRLGKKMLTKGTWGKHKVSFYEGKVTLSVVSPVQSHGLLLVLKRVRTMLQKILFCRESLQVGFINLLSLQHVFRLFCKLLLNRLAEIKPCFPALALSWLLF